MEQPLENYKSEVLETHRITYTIPEAALIWCRVSKDQIADIIKKSILLNPDSALQGEIWEHREIPCLRDASEEITKAINSGALPYELDDKSTVVNSEYPFYRRQKILRREFIKWMKDTFPDENLESIFGDTECKTNSVISVEDYQALEAQMGDLKNQIKELEEDNKALEEEGDAMESELFSLIDRVADAGELKKLERNSYSNMVAVLLKFISGDFPHAGIHPSYRQESTLISDIAFHYHNSGCKCLGLSESNLSRKFPKAKSSFEDEFSRKCTK